MKSNLIGTKRKTLLIRKNMMFLLKMQKTVFYDPEALLIFDPDHSKDEERFILLGMAQSLKVLVVCHCYRANDEIIRIISARKANNDEIKQYGG